MWLALTIVGFVWLGYEVVRYGAFRAQGAERWCAALTVAVLAWIATVWVAALTGGLYPAVMRARTLATFAAAAIFFVRRRRSLPGDGMQVPDWRIASALLPLAGWTGFVLWRSAIVPPLSHDALAYHLPRAVFWIREHRFFMIDFPVDARMRILPANYELLLSDVMLLTGSDSLTEWLAVFFFAAFLTGAAALAQRWWNAGGAVQVAATLLSASAPVLLLHAGADKNDTMTAFLMVATLLWTGRWLSEAEPASLFLAVGAIAAGIGTKPQPLMMAVFVGPILVVTLWRAWRDGRVRSRGLLALAAFAVASAVLLGGAFYAAKALQDPSLAVEGQRGGAGFVAYDDWDNLWRAPWILLTAPFSRSGSELYAPWSARPWFWQRNEMYFSHLGAVFALAVLLLPIAVRRFGGDVPERRSERRWMAFVALGTFLLMLPVRDTPMPRGIYTLALPRYVLFLIPVVLSLTVAPAIARLGSARPGLATAAIWIFAAGFVNAAVGAATQDRFVPLSYVAYARKHPGTRVIPFDPNRAASIADRVAGPRDLVAMDAGYAAWVQPLFGASLSRPVVFLGPEWPPRIPEAARWVVIDRYFAVVWQHPEFRDASQWRQYIDSGFPAKSETRLMRLLLNDPRFQAVYCDPWRNEAVFRRR